MACYDTGLNPIVEQINAAIKEKTAYKNELDKNIDTASEERDDAYVERGKAKDIKNNYLYQINIFKDKIKDFNWKIQLAQNEAARNPNKKNDFDFSIMKYQQGITQTEGLLGTTTNQFKTSSANLNFAETSLFNSKIKVNSLTSDYISTCHSLESDYLSKGKFIG